MKRRRLCDHSSRRQVTPPLKQPTRAASRNRPICRPYSVLHPVGFTVPRLLPAARCALAAPFRPYPSEGGRNPFCGTIPEPSPKLEPAGRYPAPLFRGARTFLAPLARAAAARPSDSGDIGEARARLRVGAVITEQVLDTTRIPDSGCANASQSPLSGDPDAQNSCCPALDRHRAARFSGCASIAPIGARNASCSRVWARRSASATAAPAANPVPSNWSAPRVSACVQQATQHGQATCRHDPANRQATA